MRNRFPFEALLVLWVVATLTACGQESPPSFPTPHNTQELSAPLLTAQQAVDQMHLPAGFQATLFAGEPHVQQPIGMAFDGRGRLWIAENYTYAERPLRFDRSLRDRIIVLEDVDHDGRFDRRKVFWDQAQMLTSVEVGFGGVWALCPPNLLFIPDRNRDDVPDREPIVMLDGFEDQLSGHNFVNGLRWGPDGWLYGRHGITATSYVAAPQTPKEKRTRLNCSIWRYHPVNKSFEVVCHGTTNPWGADWDQHGQMFFINTVIGHLWHVLPGAHYQRMFGSDFNPHLYQLIDQTADHYHWDTAEHWSDLKKLGMSPTSDRAGGGHVHSGLMIYLGDNWPAGYRGQLFTLNEHGRRINRDQLLRSGATYVGRHQGDFMKSDDIWFRGIDLAYGPDGGVYVIDWSDIGECHENDGVHRSSGRIYKITWQGAADRHPSGASPPIRAPTVRGLDVDQQTTAQLVQLQLHPNEWFARQARRVLQERAGVGDDLSEATRRLLELYREQTDVQLKLRAMLSLQVLGALSDDWLLDQLSHDSEHIRVWATRLLGEGDPPDAAARSRLAQLAKSDASGLVLTFLAASLQRLDPEHRWALGEQLLARGELADDRVLPLMIWYGLEQAVAEQPRRGVTLIPQSRMPRVTQFIARRVTSRIEDHLDAVDDLVRLLGDPSEQRAAILRGMSEALQGWHRATPPPSWKRLATQLEDEATVQHLVRELSLVFGDGRALEQLKQIVRDSSYSLEDRQSALRSLVQVRAEGVSDLLRRLLDQRDMAAAVANGLAVVADPQAPQWLIEKFPSFRMQGREAVIETLSSRRSYAVELLDAVQRGIIPKRYIAPFQIRRMQLLDDPAIHHTIQQLWPELRLINEDRLTQIVSYRELLTPQVLSQADRQSGRALFDKSCATCHRLFGQGNSIGPDLTGSQRTNLNYLLENVVDPSASLAPNYRMSIIELEDGRVLNGVTQETTERTLTIQTATEKIVLDRTSVYQIRTSKLSLMPDGLLNGFSEDQVRDLMAYLMSASQVPSSGEDPLHTTDTISSQP